jgi:myosin heavy subunit
MSDTMKSCLNATQSDLVKTLFPNTSSKAKKTTLGGQFRNQLVSLVDTLRSTEPHFIRCVKPNHAKKPGIFEGMLLHIMM